MIERISKNLADFICQNTNNKSECEIVAYGIEIMIATIVNIAAVVLIALILNKVKVTLVYLCTFMAFRTYTGGYHAKTHIRCLGILVLTVLIGYGLLEIFKDYLIYISFIIMTASHIVVSIYAPVADGNKPLSKRQISHSRRVCIIEIALFWCIALALYIMKQNELLFSVAYASAVTGVSVAAVTIIKFITKGGEGYEQV